jgi:hypothetical protein
MMGSFKKGLRDDQGRFPYNVMVTAGGNPFTKQVYAATSLGFC